MVQKTQDLEPVIMGNGAFFIFTKKTFKENNNRTGKNPYFYPIVFPESVEIDNKDNNDSQNFYFDITSSPNYVDFYYQDWGYGSYNHYPKDQYLISAIDESLVSQIRDQVFKSLSARYANQEINIDASFEIEDQDHLNEVIFPKMKHLR